MGKEAKHNRDYPWRSYRGTITIKEMDDMHVVNVTHLLKVRKNKLEENLRALPSGEGSDNLDYLYESVISRISDHEEILENFLAEMEYRGIPKDTLDNAPYPFIDDEGCKRLWDEEKKEFKISPPSARFIMTVKEIPALKGGDEFDNT